MNFLQSSDFEQGGQFDGVPFEVAEKLINHVKNKAAEHEQHSQELLRANVEALQFMASKGITPEHQKIFLEVANVRIRDYKRDGDGKTWRDSQDKPVFNKDFERANTQELFLLTIADDLEHGSNTQSQPRKDGSDHKNQPLPSLQGVETRVEADEIISKFLETKMGLTPSKTPAKYGEEFTRIRRETGADKLPVTKKRGFY